VHLRLDGVSHSYGDRKVLTDISLAVGAADRVGLIGENGAGKSTLLRLVARVEEPDSGIVSGPASLGLLRQEPAYAPWQRLGDVLDAALAPARAAERELEHAAAALQTGDEPSVLAYAAALDTAERLDIWSAEARRDAIVAGLGLADLPRTRRLDEISGGQRSRVALAALLVEHPLALVLDEPTNHLDDAATGFLVRLVREWHGPVLFASHDRAFLDEVATALVDIDPQVEGGLRRSGGGFSDYLSEKAAERERWQRHYDEEQEELGRLAGSVAVTSRQVAPDRAPRDNERMGYGKRANRVAHQVSRRVRNARGRLESLEREQIGAPPQVLAFAGIPRGSHPLSEGDEPVLELDDVRIEGRLGAVAPVSLRVRASTRHLVTGANGAGKSTLLALLAGIGPRPDAGAVRRRRGIRVGLLAQDARFGRPHDSPRAIYRDALGVPATERVPLESLGLLAARDLDRPVGLLSVGQQRRLALALVVARPPHVFLLDEPTNHLSLSLAVELEEAFGSYPGAVVVASHDRWLRRRWEGEVLALEP
jgi:macrolide transport system ATP-binding/permease protein